MVTKFEIIENEVSFSLDKKSVKMSIEDFFELMKEFNQYVMRSPNVRRDFRKYGFHPSGRFMF